MIKPDSWIKKMCVEHGMIEPFEPGQVRDGNISYGTSSYGYDMRVANEFRVFKKDIEIAQGAVVDPKNFDESAFDIIKTDGSVNIPANSFVIARSVEYFRIPRNVVTVCFGKSTYARCGVIVNVTPFEPEWEGYVTMSIINAAPVPAKIYANEGIAQVLFFESDEVCAVSYADKKGKYQAQKTITLPKI
ncbi:MAG TPA: dCTP deaminase [Elusimicrobia bacterium]|nr:MAG: dCTP deaminase [Elusimicrobia bacterium RIFOXYA12_FULL_49_49]OGS15504.1 MAG: dCTP deaminase [Elusimicrobia bacterium RIFOXYA2_FULL_47_53]OGS26999.1 MAG: dCTP deaminase [Elusimicrobia bacterium RIFOXYB12_FULL_50_12]OGS30944.1 MAG: dCTP deaminase [Elusimicrobia bacterium RIFOXYB2_FULL_46_23]HBU69088.1 dCTP deaminase [Elusimicrobiota bacterium]